MLDRVPILFLLIAGINFIFQMLGCILLFEIKQTDKTTLSGKDEEVLKEPLKNDHEPVKTVKINSLGIRYEDPNEGLSISQVLRLPSFYILTLMLFNFGFAPFLVVSYYKAFGQTFITNDNFLSIIGSVSSLFKIRFSLSRRFAASS